MSLVKNPEMTEQKMAAQQSNAQKTLGPATPRGKANSALANLQHGFYSEERTEVLLTLGEDPREYRTLMESLFDDLEPREGLEAQLVLRMGQALGRMQRAERMQEGLAMKQVRSQGLTEELINSSLAARALEHLAPYESLEKALSRREGPSAAEIDQFIEACGDKPSNGMAEFVLLLKSFKSPMEDEERKAARRKAKAQLAELSEGYKSAAWRMCRQVENIHSSENVAALMAPKDQNSLFMQRMEDSNLRRLWRLTNTLEKVRNGALARKDVKNADRSHDMYENKDTHDTMTGMKNEIVSENTNFSQFSTNS